MTSKTHLQSLGSTSKAYLQPHESTSKFLSKFSYSKESTMIQSFWNHLASLQPLCWLPKTICNPLRVLPKPTFNQKIVLPMVQMTLLAPKNQLINFFTKALQLSLAGNICLVHLSSVWQSKTFIELQERFSLHCSSLFGTFIYTRICPQHIMTTLLEAIISFPC